MQRHHMPAIVAHDAFGLACGAGSVEDIKRIGCFHTHTFGPAALPACHLAYRVPIMIARTHFGFHLRPLQDDARFHLMGGDFQGLIEQRLIGDDAPGLDAAGG